MMEKYIKNVKYERNVSKYKNNFHKSCHIRKQHQCKKTIEKYFLITLYYLNISHDKNI